MTIVLKYLQRRVNEAAEEKAQGYLVGNFVYKELRLLQEEYSSDIAPLLKAVDEELCSSCTASYFVMEEGCDEIVNPDRGYVVWEREDDLPF